jgi:hypothetical protein
MRGLTHVLVGRILQVLMFINVSPFPGTLDETINSLVRRRLFWRSVKPAGSGHLSLFFFPVYMLNPRRNKKQ